MCQYGCAEKLKKVRQEMKRIERGIQQMSDRYNLNWGKIEALNEMKRLRGDISPIGTYCQCAAMKKLLEAETWLACLDFLGLTNRPAKEALAVFWDLKEIIFSGPRLVVSNPTFGELQKPTERQVPVLKIVR